MTNSSDVAARAPHQDSSTSRGIPIRGVVNHAGRISEVAQTRPQRLYPARPSRRRPEARHCARAATVSASVVLFCHHEHRCRY
jgi:hypothetical protein